MDALASHSLRGTENAHELFFSPDGQQLGFTNGRTLKAVDVGSGRVRAITDFPPTGFLGGGTWTRRPHRLRRRQHAVRCGRGRRRTDDARSTRQREEGASGRRTTSRCRNRSRVVLGRARGSRAGRPGPVDEERENQGCGARHGAAVDTVHSSLIAVRSDGTVEARRFDAATGDTTGSATRIGDPVALRSPVFLYAEFAASATGTIVTVTRSPFSSSGQGTLHFNGADGKDVTHTLPFRARRVARPRFSPDGQLVAAL